MNRGYLDLPRPLRRSAGVFAGMASFLSKSYSLDHIKSKTVGDGQHGTARWATPKEIGKTYHTVPFRPRRWRKGKELPTEQGLILGSVGGRKRKSKAGISAENLPQAAGKAAPSCGGSAETEAETEEKIEGAFKSQKDDRGAGGYPGAGG